MVKRCTAVLMVFIAVLIFAGCALFKGAVSFSENVSVIGIDEEKDQVVLTVTVKLIQPIANEESGKKQKVAIYTSYGETIFDAVRNFNAYTNKDLFWGHFDYIIIGQDTAGKGINKYLDLFVRDHETKINSRLVIAQGSTASEFIKKTNVKQSTLNDILKSLFDNAEQLSQSNDVMFIDYMQMVNTKGVALHLPCVQMVNYMEKESNELDKKDVQLNGYAIFDDDKLIGFVRNKMARGINWIINEIESGIIITQDPEGKKISLEIISADSNIEPDFSKDIPSATVKITFTTNIGEYQGTADIFDQDILEFIVKQQDKIIKKEVENTIEYLQAKKCDIGGFLNKIYHKYPVKIKELEQDWKDTFSEMDISVEVSSIISRTYNIKEPVGHEGVNK